MSGVRKAAGIVFILLALISIGSGGYIWQMNTQHLDSSGYTISQKISITSDSPAIVFSDHTFNMQANTPGFIQVFVNPDSLVTERWTVKNNQGKNIFIGITTPDKASEFLKTVHYKEANQWDVSAGA